VGDLLLDVVQALADPCPLPANQKARRTLNEREQVIYAPHSGLGGLVYGQGQDAALYIDIGGSQSFLRVWRANSAGNGAF
jgi:ribosome biogenesis protein BMS1